MTDSAMRSEDPSVPQESFDSNLNPAPHEGSEIYRPGAPADLPVPKPLGLKNLAGLIGPGIVMCGIQIGGGEWLFGPDVTAKYGGGLMWDRDNRDYYSGVLQHRNADATRCIPANLSSSPVLCELHRDQRFGSA
jgi:hypothetical protein